MSADTPDPVQRAVLKPRVAALTQAAIEEIRSATNELPTVDEIIWLHSLAERQILPSTDDPPAYLPQPIELKGGVVLFPITLEAQMWLTEYAVRWFVRDDLPVVAFAMAHSGGNFSFTRLTHRARTIAMVYAWWWRTPVSRALMTWAVSHMANRQEYVMLNAKGLTPQEQDDASPFEWGSIIARLCASYHLPPDTFLKMPEHVVVDMLRRAPKLTAQIAGGGSDDIDPIKQQAFAHYRIVISYIITKKRFERKMEIIEKAVAEIESFLHKEHADG